MTREQFVQMAGWLDTVTPDQIPVGAALYPGVTITQPAGFLAALRRDVLRWLDGPRMRFGALERDCAALYRIIQQAGKEAA